MAHAFADRVKEGTSTTGTGPLTLTGALAGFETIASCLTTDGDTGFFCAVNGIEWETFLGTRTSSTVLARTQVLASSNGGASVSFTAAPVVFLTIPASTLKLPADKCYVYLNTAANSAGAWAKVPLDTAASDTNSLWDSTNKRIVIKKPGHYQVSCRIRTTTAGDVAAGIYLNGAFATIVGSDGSLVATGGSSVISCSAGDYVELYAYTNTVRAFTTGVIDTHLELIGPL